MRAEDRIKELKEELVYLNQKLNDEVTSEQRKDIKYGIESVKSDIAYQEYLLNI